MERQQRGHFSLMVNNPPSHVMWKSFQNTRETLNSPKDAMRTTPTSVGSTARFAPDATPHLDEETVETIVRIQVDHWGLLPCRKTMALLWVVMVGCYVSPLVIPYEIQPLVGLLPLIPIATLCILPVLMWVRYVLRSIETRAINLDSPKEKEAIKRVRRLLHWHIFNSPDVHKVNELRAHQGLSRKEAMVAMLKEYLLKEFKVQELPSRLS